jgi:hypothetical protein
MTTELTSALGPGPVDGPPPYDPFDLPSVGRPIAWDDALAAVLGYARATRPLTLTAKGSFAAEVVDVPAFAYRAYDCVPPSGEAGFAWIDVLVVDSLNGRLRHPTITALMDAGSRAWKHVDAAIRLAADRPFWELPNEEVGRYPTPGSAGAALNRAWEECMRTDEVAVALTHKLLHHKRPDLFPLIDGKTLPRLSPPRAQRKSMGLWAVLHQELNVNREQFARLEEWFAALVNASGDVPLNRLRLHDILLWLKATRRWEYAVARGRETPEWQRYTR